MYRLMSIVARGSVCQGNILLFTVVSALSGVNVFRSVFCSCSLSLPCCLCLKSILARMATVECLRSIVGWLVGSYYMGP